jgi:putative heme-binding domain-containing protein
MTTATERRAVLDSFTAASDNWTRSAIVAAATEHASSYVTDALTYSRPQALSDFVVAVTPAALPADAARLLVAAAGAGPEAAALKASVVRAVARMEGGAIALNSDTTQALQKLLDDPATTAAALPIVAKWDKAGALGTSVDTHAQALLRDLSDPTATDDRRIDNVGSLLAVPARRKHVLSAIAPMLTDPGVSAALKGRLIATLGENPGRDVDEVLVGTLARTSSTPAFDQILKRTESTRLLLQAMEAEKVTLANLGPANIARLRTHPNRQIALGATELLDALSPAVRAKADIVASLLPEVEKPGDATKGKALFTGACATCHKLGDLGKIEVGPPLNGMGTHGRAELLGHIIDPNREVDPSFWQWNVTTKKGETLSGVIATENASSLTLRGPAGDVEIKKEEITNRENTRRSLMPEGLEALGAESLRDILTFLAGDSQKFRIVDLRQVYTADSRRGFRREDERDETVALNRFGDVTVAGVPFFIMDPARSPNGTNLVALKGGPGSGIIADDFPRRVQIPTTANAASLHFLGGVGGWAWPTGTRGTPAMKVVVEFADGASEEHVFKNGEVFADTFVRAEVPLSTDAGDFVRRGQLRYFAVNLGKKGTLSKIVLESYDNDIVPATVAITASAEPISGRSGPLQAQPPSATPKEGGKGDAPLPETKPIVWAPGKKRVLIIGGGSSHNFGKFFGETDSATLAAAGFSVNYTEDRDQAAAEIGKADIAVISVNRQFFDTPEYRKALMDFAAAGKGLVMVHPGVWYGFAQWPELNATIVGGGARGHDRIAKYSVNALKPEHPVMKGVPASFEVEDELYYLNAEPDKIPAGTAPIDVLAETSPSVRYKQPHPAVWITRHATARIVGITLGHDERVHDLQPFRTLLVNAVRWAGRVP